MNKRHAHIKTRMTKNNPSPSKKHFKNLLSNIIYHLKGINYVQKRENNSIENITFFRENKLTIADISICISQSLEVTNNGN